MNQQKHEDQYVLDGLKFDARLECEHQHRESMCTTVGVAFARRCVRKHVVCQAGADQILGYLDAHPDSTCASCRRAIAECRTLEWLTM